MSFSDYTIVGLKEIAELLEVDNRTPHAWLYRDLLPGPDYLSINGYRAWNRRTILKWAASTGRLPRSGSLHDEAQKYMPKLKQDERLMRGGRRVKAKGEV